MKHNIIPNYNSSIFRWQCTNCKEVYSYKKNFKEISCIEIKEELPEHKCNFKICNELEES